MEIESIKKNLKDLDEILSQCVELEEETFREKRNKLINSFKGAPISLDSSGSHFIISHEQIQKYESELSQSNSKLLRIKQTIDQLVEQRLMVDKDNNLVHQKNVELLTKVETLTNQLNSLERKIQADEREATILRAHIERQNDKINSLQEEVKFLEIKALEIQSQKDILLREVGERVIETRNISLIVPPKTQNEDYMNKYLHEQLRAENLEVLLDKAEQQYLSLVAEIDSLKKKGNLADVLMKEKKQRILDFFSKFEDAKSNNDLSDTNIEFEVAAFFSETAGRLKLTIENEGLKEEIIDLRQQLERSEETYQIRIKNYKEV